LISSKIEETKDIPEIISETGKIGMPHKGLQWSSLLSLDFADFFLGRDYAEDGAAVPPSDQH